MGIKVPKYHIRVACSGFLARCDRALSPHAVVHRSGVNIKIKSKVVEVSIL